METGSLLRPKRERDWRSLSDEDELRRWPKMPLLLVVSLVRTGLAARLRPKRVPLRRGACSTGAVFLWERNIMRERELAL